VFTKSCELANSEILKEKLIGIDILAQLGTTPRLFLDETLDLYFKLLTKETNPEVLWSILYGVGFNNDNLTASQVSFLTSFKSSKNLYVRHSLVSALLFIDNDEAIRTLIDLTNDKASYIRDWATFGIGQIDKDSQEIRDVLWKKVNDKDQNTRLEAIAGLAKRKDEKIKEVIKKMLLDGEIGILLIEAIEEFNDVDFLPLLEKVLAEYINKKEEYIKIFNALDECIENLKKLELKI
jgi:HEAT repeat protein